MTRVVVQVRCHDVGQKVRWEAAAAARGLSLSGWLRGAAEDQVALEVAVAREAEGAGEGVGPVSSVFARRFGGVG